ncbi:transmembrane reductase CYB561D2-like [Apis laboriosa]|uniref:transmembrane reductase CYB561D2-like n=1 Tax=Apis laboriosa TaxID=183418 RepID=UPI001CC5C9C9|nr:transmembrane reductase CYB561D2-like [Apis laboriosa]
MEEAGRRNEKSFSMEKVDAGRALGFPDNSTNLEDSNESRRSTRGTCLAVLDLVNHALIVGLTAYTLYRSWGSNVVNLHTIFCTIGYVLLMSEAIVVFAGDSVFTKFLSRGAKRHLHWILQILGLILIVSGVMVMYRVKPVHFKSIHGILGITSAVLAVFLSVAGYPVFIAAKLRNAIKPVAIKFAHNFLGISCFAIGMAAQCYGYTYIFKSDLKFVFIIIVVAIIALSIRRAIPSLFRQFLGLFR